MDGPYSNLEPLQAARALAPRIVAAADQIEQERRLPADLVYSLAEAGLFRMVVPVSLGGGEVSLITISEVMEEVAKADASTAWCISQNSGICRWAGYLPREGAEEVFGQPDLRIAWGNGPSTAVRVDGGHKLTGRWSFTSGIRHATWLGCQGTGLVDAAGQPVLNETGQQKRLIFFFPPSDAEITDVWQVSGLKGTGSDSFSVADLFVPDSRSPQAAPLESGPLYLFNTTNIFSVGFASVALGLARSMLDSFLDLAITKSPRDVTGLLRERAPSQVHVGRAEATLRSARAFLRESVATAWEGASRTGELSIENRILIRLSTTFAIEQSAKVVDLAYNLAGATAIFNSNPFERRFRDMHAVTQHIQGREDHYEPIGQFFLGLEPSLIWL